MGEVAFLPIVIALRHVKIKSYRGGPFRLLYGLVMPLIRAAFRSDDEHRDLLIEAGFTEVTTTGGKNWIFATGYRAAIAGPSYLTNALFPNDFIVLSEPCVFLLRSGSQG